MTDIRIEVLGPLEATVGGRPVALGGPKQRAVLAALLLAEGRLLTVEHLVDVLWPEDPPTTAITKVQGHVSALRKALAEAGCARPADVLVTRAPGYLLRGPVQRTDLDAFDRLVSDAAARAPRDPAGALRLLTAALALWRGPAFADVAAPAIQAAAARLADRRLAAAEDRAEIELVLGRHREALDQLGPLLDEHPFRDRLRELHMLALIRMERPMEAIASYERCRTILSRELGVEPCGRLRRLAASIGYPS
ncbi:BTAD domain-containing putative transcriptional regulator [Dactylosporangium sp. NPDC051485]|uniref:AfsR/SARP family transcriptional regulator n=1 Tax=Dactylosporangium sp. NPDC051485 TaxID=3154846 RepID=UPI00341D31D7